MQWLDVFRKSQTDNREFDLHELYRPMLLTN